MKYIAHRGNTRGRKPELENSPGYILDAMRNYDVEIDVWYISGDDCQLYGLGWGWYLGHDTPTYYVPEEFLRMNGLWVHVKNFAGMQQLVSNPHSGVKNYFWHESDTCALTSAGYLWTCDRTKGGSRTVYMMVEGYPEEEMVKRMDEPHLLPFSTYCSDWVAEPRGPQPKFRTRR